VRRLRLSLVFLIFVSVLFDIREVMMIRTFGWPPDHLLDFDETGAMVDPPASAQIVYGLFLLGVGLVQVVILRYAWKAWRKPGA
jgi:hypothetical protein